MARLTQTRGRDRKDVSTDTHSNLVRNAWTHQQTIAQLVYWPSEEWITRESASEIDDWKAALDFGVRKAEEQVRAAAPTRDDRGAAVFLELATRLREGLPPLSREAFRPMVLGCSLEREMLRYSETARGDVKVKSEGFVDLVMTVSVPSGVHISGVNKWYFEDFVRLDTFSLLDNDVPETVPQDDLIDFARAGLEQPSWHVEWESKELWIDVRSTGIQVAVLLRDLHTMADLRVEDGSADGHDVLVLATDVNRTDQAMISAEGFFVLPAKALAPVPNEAGGARRSINVPRRLPPSHCR